MMMRVYSKTLIPLTFSKGITNAAIQNTYEWKSFDVEKRFECKQMES